MVLQLVSLFLVLVAFPAPSHQNYSPPPPPKLAPLPSPPSRSSPPPPMRLSSPPPSPRPPPMIQIFALEGSVDCSCPYPYRILDTESVPAPDVKVTLQCGNPRSTGMVKFETITTSWGYFYLKGVLPDKKYTKTCRVFPTPPSTSKCAVAADFAGFPVFFKEYVMSGHLKIPLFTTGLFRIPAKPNVTCYPIN